MDHFESSKKEFLDDIIVKTRERLDTMNAYEILEIRTIFRRFTNGAEMIYQDTNKPFPADKLHRIFLQDERRIYDAASKYEEIPKNALKTEVMQEVEVFSEQNAIWEGAYFHKMNKSFGLLKGIGKMGDYYQSVQKYIEKVKQTEKSAKAVYRGNTGLWIFLCLIGIMLVLFSGSSLPVVPDFLSVIVTGNRIARVIVLVLAVLAGMLLFGISGVVTEDDSLHILPLKITVNKLTAFAALFCTCGLWLDASGATRFDIRYFHLIGIYYIVISLIGLIDDCFEPKRRKARAIKEHEDQKNYLKRHIDCNVKAIRAYIYLHEHIWKNFVPDDSYPAAIDYVKESLEYMLMLSSNGGAYLPPPDKKQTK